MCASMWTHQAFPSFTTDYREVHLCGLAKYWATVKRVSWFVRLSACLLESGNEHITVHHENGRHPSQTVIVNSVVTHRVPTCHYLIILSDKFYCGFLGVLCAQCRFLLGEDSHLLFMVLFMFLFMSCVADLFTKNSQVNNSR